MKEFSRTSGWVFWIYALTLFNFAGFLILAFKADYDFRWDFAIYGIAVGISGLFFAFIVQAIIDIRYILYQTLLAIKEKSPAEKSE